MSSGDCFRSKLRCRSLFNISIYAHIIETDVLYILERILETLKKAYQANTVYTRPVWSVKRRWWARLLSLAAQIRAANGALVLTMPCTQS